MKIASTPRLAASLAALALWALVAASALYWVWQVPAPALADAPLAGNPADLEQAADAQAVARALGAAGAHAASGAGDASGRFVLRGVVTHGPDSGAALIAVDGKPPKPVRAGAPVGDAEGWTLRAVTPSRAVLADGAHEVTLDVPRPDARLDAHADALSGIQANPPAPVTPVQPMPPIQPMPAAPAPLPGGRGMNLMAPRLPQS
jgi:general secretion pathway protein C